MYASFVTGGMKLVHTIGVNTHAMCVMIMTVTGCKGSLYTVVIVVDIVNLIIVFRSTNKQCPGVVQVF